jgi:predicted regulator of Ras-like GTPase activity (Roadblock/LC7/MglB family)
MAAALVSVGSRVGSALESGVPKNIVIEGENKTIIVRKMGSAALIATAPKGAKIGLIDFEISKATAEVESTL